MFFSVASFSDEPEVFLLEYSRPAILHAAHFRRVIKPSYSMPTTKRANIARDALGASNRYG